jgi:NitT/TauT family transport system ATP-binding protein
MMTAIDSMLTREAPSQSKSAPALSLNNISCSFGNYEVIDSTSFRINDGEFLSIVGPTGCGKSTLLNMAAGLLTPTKGDVEVFGVPLEGINRTAGYMFQAESLMPWFTARENVMAGLEFHGVDKAERHDQAMKWLGRVGLTGHESKYPHQLSGGMRKRVSLAQTLILNPKIVLMDEPFSALDIQTRQLMENELLELWQQDRKSVMFITHDLEEAISLSDRVVIMSAGPRSKAIAEFEIDLPRPRDVAEIRMTPRFVALHAEIWSVMRTEVLKGYATTMSK